MSSNHLNPAGADTAAVPNARDVEATASGWLAARDGHGWNAQRQQELDEWLAQSTSHLVAFLRLEAAWTRADRLQALKGAEAPARPSESSTSRPEARQEPHQQKRQQPFQQPHQTPISHPRAWARPMWHWGAVAGAALVLALTIGVSEPGGIWPWRQGEAHSTAVGERAVVALTDGSTVTMNTATRLRTEVDAHQRRVWLDGGEAYFDIAHDAQRPFVIQAGGQRVTVIGTRFSLRRDGDRLRVRVVEGRVQVESPSGASAVLAAADTADATRSTLKLQHESPQVITSGLAWMQGQLQFDGLTLAQAATEFNRYNKRALRIEDERTGQIRIDGTFDVHNVDGFARLLRAGFGLKVEERDNEIVVR